MAFILYFSGSVRDWTLVGVLLTAVFTGGGMIASLLGYRLGRSEFRANQRTLYKFPMVDLTQHWIGVLDRPGETAVQMRLVFENKHPLDPIRYEIEEATVAFVQHPGADAGPPVSSSDPSGGVVPPGLLWSFTLAPAPRGGHPLIPVVNPPTYALVNFTIRYGAVRHHREFEFEWRERRSLMANLWLPPDLSATQYSIPYTFSPVPNAVERLSRRSLRERITRQP